jgi:hypothetical protein
MRAGASYTICSCLLQGACTAAGVRQALSLQCLLAWHGGRQGTAGAAQALAALRVSSLCWCVRGLGDVCCSCQLLGAALLCTHVGLLHIRH